VHDAGWKRRDNHAELTREGLRRAKERGVKLGNHTNAEEARRLGRESQTARANEFALKIYEIILPMKEQGMPLDTIAEYLNSQNIATARGGKWYSKSVSNVWVRAKAVLSKESA
jgi:DNA invertase Pin-like site-specific DNA recombinase